MLEVRYNTATKQITAWCGDENQFGNLERDGHTVVILDIPIPVKPPGALLYVEATNSLIDNPSHIEPEPPRSTYIAIIDAIDVAKARPVKVKRVWESKDYFYDCFVTETVKDQYIAGDVAIGDYVLVHFDYIGEQVVTAKVFKSW